MGSPRYLSAVQKGDLAAINDAVRILEETRRRVRVQSARAERELEIAIYAADAHAVPRSKIADAASITRQRLYTDYSLPARTGFCACPEHTHDKLVADVELVTPEMITAERRPIRRVQMVAARTEAEAWPAELGSMDRVPPAQWPA